MIIRRFGPLSCARIAGVLYALLGVVIGAIFSLASVVGGLASSSSEDASLRAAMGIAAILVFPVLYGGLGFVGTLIAAWLYNALVEVVGGIEVELQER